MAGEENLIPMNQRTEEEQREIARKGGIASGKARQEKKRMRETIDTILKMVLNPGKGANIEEIQAFAELKGKNLTVEQAMIVQQIQKALKGDLQALTFLRDTSGQKPAEQISMSAAITDKTKDIEDYVNNRKPKIPGHDN